MNGAAAEIVVTAAGEGDRILLAVADRGPGIPQADRGRVVERFVRLEQSRSEPGSGLGLSLASAVAHLHGGELKLEDNDPGLKTVISLPRAVGPAGGLKPLRYRHHGLRSSIPEPVSVHQVGGVDVSQLRDKAGVAAQFAQSTPRSVVTGMYRTDQLIEPAERGCDFGGTCQTTVRSRGGSRRAVRSGRRRGAGARRRLARRDRRSAGRRGAHAACSRHTRALEALLTGLADGSPYLWDLVRASPAAARDASRVRSRAPLRATFSPTARRADRRDTRGGRDDAPAAPHEGGGGAADRARRYRRRLAGDARHRRC